MLPRALVVAAWFLLLFGFTRSAHAVPLAVNGSAVGPATCPGGVAVDRTCNVNATASLNRGCRYGGTHTFDSISITNGGFVCVTPFNGVDKNATGNLVLKSLTTIVVDASSEISAKGTGYSTPICGDGTGPTATAGGRGGCSVLDSGGGGAHFGAGGRGTKDCFVFGSATACEFPNEWEEDCGELAPGGTSCVTAPDPNNAVCYGTTNVGGAGNALPSVAGQAYEHSIYVPEFGASGGEMGCRDGFDSAQRSGRGGGRIVLFAANAGQTGVLTIDGRIIADGRRGCSSGNDSAGGGGGGSVLLIGDTVNVTATARVSAHGGRGGDSQPKCTTCTSSAECQSGQSCVNGRCGPCNCTPCTSNAQCNTLLGQTCKALGGALGNVCADANNQCTPFDPGDNEDECKGTQNSGTCDDCAGGGGGGIVNVQSRSSKIHPSAIFDVRGAAGGICAICSGEAGGGAGELQIDSGYRGEICDGFDNDFNGSVDEGLGTIACPGNTTIPACVNGVPQTCDYPNPALCLIPATDARPRFALVVDTSGSMLNDVAGNPTFGDGSVGHPGIDTGTDPDAVGGNNSRLFIAKQALAQVLSSFPESDYALGRYYQDVGANRSCQTASNFECAKTCCSYDDPTNNLPPPYPSTYPGNTCVLSQLYSSAGYPNVPSLTSNLPIGWMQEGNETPPTDDCINYAGSCGPPRRGAQFVVGFGEPIQKYLKWLDGVEDADAVFNAGTVEGNHCPNGNCELRGTGPTPLAGSLQATYDYLKKVVSCDSAKACRTTSVILLTDGAESCEGNPQAAAAALFQGIAGKAIRTYVIGFSVLPTEQTQLNQIAAAGGTTQAYFVQSKSQLADALATILGENQKFELCNGLDDDCDALVDETFPEKNLPCTDGEIGKCLGIGTYQCKADGSGTECVLSDPGQMPTMEICNSLDDDCDGLVDEDDQGAPLPCPSCVPSPEICDGIDNDCDNAIDEQSDVATNQPTIFGVACGMLTPPNDQLPCQLGTVLCINAQPVCVGYKGPKEEICNGVDDDCDGVGDEMAACPGATECVEGQCLAPCSGGEFPCPNGYLCEEGHCYPTACNGVDCGAGRICDNGECVDVSGAGGGSATQSSGATAGVGGQGGALGTGGQGGQGGSGGQGASGPAQNWGLATGGGGCAAGPGGARPEGWIAALVVLGGAIVARRRRRVRSGGAS